IKSALLILLEMLELSKCGSAAVRMWENNHGRHKPGMNGSLPPKRFGLLELLQDRGINEEVDKLKFLLVDAKPAVNSVGNKFFLDEGCIAVSGPTEQESYV
ncbi:hypothetical protein MMC11_008734, partial [Xylographa trunciseda]|nr:hypothetical protein [Xylographa trunciseda]